MRGLKPAFRRRRGEALALPHRRGVEEHAARPAIDVEFANDVAHQAHAVALLVHRHAQRDMKRRRALVGVVRIDNERLRQFTRCAGELRQDEHAALVVVRRDEFLGHEVHAVVQAADETEVGGAMVLVHGILLVMLGQQHDRRMGGARVGAVDLLGQPMHALRVVLIVADRASRRRGDLHERELADPFRMQFQQARDRVEALDDALRVVEAVDADAELVVARQIEAHAHALARFVDGEGGRQRRRRPLDRDRIAVDRGALAAADDGERLAVDPRLDEAIDGLQEVVAVELRVKAQDVAAEQPVQQLDAPRADRERLGIGPRDVPERDDRRLRQPVADHPRQQREMVVLDQHDRVLALRFRDDGIGELRVDGPILIPVGGAERRPHVGDVAQRPQPFVGEAVVVALRCSARQPQAADPVRRIVGRHGDAVVAIDDLAIGAAAAVRDPRAGAGAHHRLERGDEAAGRLLHVNPLRRLDVDVRLAIGDDDDVVAAHLAAQHRAQRLLRPALLAFVGRPELVLQLAQQRLHVARDRAQLGRGAAGGGPQDAFAAQQRAQAQRPSRATTAAR